MYITDMIGEDYKEWHRGNIAVINAQTGSGKTHFALKVLLPFLAQEKKSMLYLCNRSALKDQILRDSEEFKEYRKIMNYQEFEKITLNNDSDTAKDILNREYWVLDEAHYFLADASFNGETLSCLEEIKRQKEQRVLIFMTATVEYLFLGLGKLGMISTDVPKSGFVDDVLLAVPRYRCTGYLNDAKLDRQLSSLKNLQKYKEITDTQFSSRYKYENANTLEGIQFYFSEIFRNILP